MPTSRRSKKTTKSATYHTAPATVQGLLPPGRGSWTAPQVNVNLAQWRASQLGPGRCEQYANSANNVANIFISDRVTNGHQCVRITLVPAVFYDDRSRRLITEVTSGHIIYSRPIYSAHQPTSCSYAPPLSIIPNCFLFLRWEFVFGPKWAISRPDRAEPSVSSCSPGNFLLDGLFFAEIRSKNFFSSPFRVFFICCYIRYLGCLTCV